MERYETDADGRTFSVSGGFMTRAGLDGDEAEGVDDAYGQALVDRIIAAGHFDVTDRTWLRAHSVAQLELLAERTSARPKIIRMPGMRMGQSLRAHAHAEPSGHFRMPGIAIGRPCGERNSDSTNACTKSSKSEIRVHARRGERFPRMPGIRSGKPM